MSHFWSPQVRSLVPYVPGEQPRMAGLVKLNTNENPYPPSPRVAEAIAQAASGGLQLYPDPSSTALRGAIATACGTTPGQVFVGNGSDEVLALAFYAFFRHGTPLLMPDISYSFYRVYCDLYGIEPDCVPLDAALRLDVSGYERASGRVTGVVVANPNAPTGIALPLADIERLLLAHPDRVVLVDEAYVDFGAESSLALVDRHANLLVVQTLSKSRSLAGLRVGFAVGQRHLVEALERVKDSFNSYPLDRLAQAGAQASFEDVAYFEKTRRAVIDSRGTLAAALTRLGFEVLPSAANFLFVRHPEHDAAALAARLRAEAILVRHFRLPRIEQYLRITIGTPEQCRRLADVLADRLA